MCSLHSLETTRWASYKTASWSPHLLDISYILGRSIIQNQTRSHRQHSESRNKEKAVMTGTTGTSSKGGFASTLRRIPKFFGFSKAYNFILFFIFGGAMFGFGLARFMYIDIPGILCGPLPGENRASPGECYYYMNFDQYKVGIRLHLYTILRMLPYQQITTQCYTNQWNSGCSSCCSSIRPGHSIQSHHFSPHQWLHPHTACSAF